MLNISEHFFSIQGEGHTVGVPSYFVRLQGCNLMCGGPNASLVKQGKATWWCDSEVIWKRGNKTENEELVSAWKEQGLLDRILAGNINIIWTGGEPTIPRHQKAIREFVDFIYDTYAGPERIYNEIETNGTIVTSDGFYTDVIDQINCSPKLANSGMAESMRIIPEAIEQINHHHNGWFKFVVSDERDFEEIQKTYLQPFNIPNKKVIIMPGVDNRDDLPERTAFLFDMAKKYGYRAITRQHILAWDRVTGV